MGLAAAALAPESHRGKETHHLVFQNKGKGWSWGGEIQLGKSQGTFSGSFLHISECTEQPSGAVTPCCGCQRPSSQRDRLMAAQTPALSHPVSTSTMASAARNTRNKTFTQATDHQ